MGPMPNRYILINQVLKETLTSHMARGLYYKAYFELVERVGEEVVGKWDVSDKDNGTFGPRLSTSEALYIADRVEVYLKGKVFKV